MATLLQTHREHASWRDYLELTKPRVVVLMEHAAKNGEHKLLQKCTLPLTGLCVVTRVYTDLAVLERRHDRMHVIDLAPGVSFDMVQRATSVPLIAP